MSTSPAQSRYIADSVSTATPAQLVVMLYDRLSLDLRRAQDAFASADPGARDLTEARINAAPHLLHAQQILAEMLATLRLDVWDGAGDLAGLYSFLIRELVQVNLDSDPARLAVCTGIVTELQTAWRTAAAQLSSGGSARVA